MFPDYVELCIVMSQRPARGRDTRCCVYSRLAVDIRFVNFRMLLLAPAHSDYVDLRVRRKPIYQCLFVYITTHKTFTWLHHILVGIYCSNITSFESYS